MLHKVFELAFFNLDSSFFSENNFDIILQNLIAILVSHFDASDFMFMFFLGTVSPYNWFHLNAKEPK